MNTPLELTSNFLGCFFWKYVNKDKNRLELEQLRLIRGEEVKEKSSDSDL